MPTRVYEPAHPQQSLPAAAHTAHLTVGQGGLDDAIEPGTVMVLGDAAELEPSTGPYDTRVAGVIAAASCADDTETAEMPVALMGKVFVKAEARLGAISVGDLLTTSERPGYAMKVSDPGRALGAILGKAMGPLPCGRTGLIPVLVALQ